jgi:hypothetical protein
MHRLPFEMAGRAERETRLAFGHPRIDQMVHPRFAIAVEIRRPLRRVRA